MRKCPECGKWYVEYSEYFHRYRCLGVDCGWCSLGCHKSPNNWPPGTEQYRAEAWMLISGMDIPDQSKHPKLYQAMIEEYRDHR